MLDLDLAYADLSRLMPSLLQALALVMSGLSLALAPVSKSGHNLGWFWLAQTGPDTPWWSQTDPGSGWRTLILADLGWIRSG